jgi:hypothetical protein
MLRQMLFLCSAMCCAGVHAEERQGWSLDNVTDAVIVHGKTQTAQGVGEKSLVLDGESVLVLEGSEKLAGAEFTVSLWFNPYELTCGQQMLAGRNRYSRDERQRSLTIEPDGGLKAHLRQSGWSTIVCPERLTARKWHQVTLVAGRQNAAFYLNGKPIGTVPLQALITNTAAPITLGGIGDANAVRQAFCGAVDEFSFRPKALSAQEVTAGYEPVSAMHELPKPAAEWPLWDAGLWRDFELPAGLVKLVIFRRLPSAGVMISRSGS